MRVATSADVYEVDLEDGYIPDADLENDLGQTGQAETWELTEVALVDIYHQQVVTNQLLGHILALSVLWTIFGLGMYFRRLVNNIFKHL